MTKIEREEKLKEKLFEMQSYENRLRDKGIKFIAGIDEVGRGPLAGPVCTCAIVLPDNFSILGVDDSKKLSEKKREELYDKILSEALAYGIGIVDNNMIDKINILEATKLAMKISVENANSMLKSKNLGEIEHLLIDAVVLKDVSIDQTSIIKGDQKSISIAAASIVAKVTRDRMMVEYAKEYPYYAFEKNKGYGTKAHYDGIKEHGITQIHRKSFLKGII